jgi:hypothetical protein
MISYFEQILSRENGFYFQAEPAARETYNISGIN